MPAQPVERYDNDLSVGINVQQLCALCGTPAVDQDSPPHTVEDHNQGRNDPLVLAHARALLVSDPLGRTAYIDADLTKPDKILTNPDLQAVLDLTQPVGLLMIAVLMLTRDSDDPWTATRTLMDALPSGSYLAITHPGQDFDPTAMDAIVQAATGAGMTLVPRERADVQRFFADWEMIDPGVVPVMTWHPDDEPPADPNAAYYWAGLARKP